MSSENKEHTDRSAAEPIVEGVEPMQPEGSDDARSEDGEGPSTGELLGQIESLTTELDNEKERRLRAVADLENYRKRALREKEEVRRYAGAGLAEDLLPVLDNFTLGLESARQHEGAKAFVDGFEMVLSQLRNALTQHGLKEMKPVDEAFDPNRHECVAHIPSDEVEEGRIIEVTRVGYTLHDRLLRPASVIVSSGKAGS